MSSVAADHGKFEIVAARPDEARDLLSRALLTDPAMAVQTFGRVAYQRHVEMYAGWLHECGEAAAAGTARGALSALSVDREISGS